MRGKNRGNRDGNAASDDRPVFKRGRSQKQGGFRKGRSGGNQGKNRPGKVRRMMSRNKKNSSKR